MCVYVIQKSYDYYKTLDQIAQVPSNLQNATIGLMHTSFNLSKFNEAINYANKVINIETIENPDKQIANIYIAKSCFQIKVHKNLGKHNF